MLYGREVDTFVADVGVNAGAQEIHNDPELGATILWPGGVAVRTILEDSRAGIDVEKLGLGELRLEETNLPKLLHTGPFLVHALGVLG